jgi:phenylpropionate dioxygenase-like ring-hydroxylating dioxygenase large terminal subunit
MTTEAEQRTERGARSSGPTYQEIIDTDGGKVPDILRWQSDVYLGSDDIDVERYISREFHDLEVRKLWRKVWQMACREEDIPNVGDHIVYEIADDSLILVRSAPSTIKALYNSCLHRGTQLRTTDGTVPQFRCPFHGWTWNLDGSMKTLPTPWDFPHIDTSTACLPEAKVATWGGFVFINMDPDAEPLATFLGDLPTHFERYEPQRRWKAVHVAKPIRANWKATQEAFLESYHVSATHPQVLAVTGDTNSQYDVWPDSHYNRHISPGAVASPSMGDVPAEVIIDALTNLSAGYDFLADPQKRMAVIDVEQVLPGQSARDVVAAATRAQAAADGMDLSDVSDAELLDAITYLIFPNVNPWISAKPSIVYRFRPYGNNPDMSVMECMFLVPLPEGAEPRKGVDIHWLDVDSSWVDAPELGILAAIFDQDTANLPRVQRGMHASKKGRISLADYQEVRIRHFHKQLDRFISA